MAGAALQRFGILVVLFGGFSAYISPSEMGAAASIMLIGFVVGIFGFGAEVMSSVDS
ncbi:hypothetical protein GRS48_06335 [Halorubrum sp. JWXQ-INN 858]|uniref:hypothetical protein n=1 Tax=Halorubrum sp. JWXQ-INN 858 TaxID=2690782 RepID=UPI00135A5EB0|nr:hypothetical protein [Halorubrum sp. JWXQ-INN 858]MWV64442.1 hypothetical protein [Halorubrum sp. JWXQ-INN 858]